MNPIAGAIIAALSAISTKKQHEAQGILAQYRQQQDQDNADLKYKREKELISLKNKMNANKSSTRTSTQPTYQQEIIVQQNAINNALKDPDKAFEEYKDLALLPQESQKYFGNIAAILSNKKAPVQVLNKAKVLYETMEQDTGFQNENTRELWNELAHLEPDIIQRIDKPIYSNDPVVIQKPKEKKGNWFSNFFLGEK